MKQAGWVFDIQRFSLHDGPGIRTTVFLKGCPLRCPWCHNPEGLEQGPQIRLTMSLCMLCGRCVHVCSQNCHEVSAESHKLHLETCERCGKCVEVCPTASLEMVGKRMSVEDVLAVVRRDVPFYEQSGGGMTLSGGEPLAQYSFSKALLQAAKNEGMHTAIETSAHISWTRLEPLKPLADLFLVDLKHTDPSKHKELTGISNRRILANVRRMAEEQWPLVLRIPWIPTMNTEDSFLNGLAAFLKSLPMPLPVEFMLYHRLGNSKWSALGQTPTMPEDIPPATSADTALWIQRLTEIGVIIKT